MKHWMGALALAGAIGLAGTPALAGELWRGVGTRMDHGLVISKFPTAKRPDAQPRLPGPDVGDLAAPVDLAGHPAIATFYFNKGGSADITVAVTDPSLQAGESGLTAAKAVAEQIDEDIGQKRRCKELSRESPRRYDCVWPVANNRLARLSYAEVASGPPMLSVIFRPAHRAQMDIDRAAEMNAERTRVLINDPSTKMVGLYGPEGILNPFGGAFVDWNLYSLQGPSQIDTLGLSVLIRYGGYYRRGYLSATDSDGASLVVKPLSHHKDRCKDCDYSETLEVALDAAKLAGELSKPYVVTINAVTGEASTIAIDPAVIRGQFVAIAQHGGPPAPPDPGDGDDPPALDFGAALTDAPARANAPAAARLDRIDGAGLAAAAGLRNGDVVTRVDGATVTDGASGQAAVAAIAPGRRVFFELLRGGKPMTMQVQF